MRIFLTVAFCFCTLAASSPHPSFGEQLDVSNEIAKPDKSKKVANEIYRVRDLNESRALSSEDIWKSHRAKIFGDSIQVEVILTRDADEDARRLLSESGGRIHLWYQKSVEMIIPWSSLEWFEDQSVVVGVYLPRYAEPLDVISQGLDTLGIPAFHNKGFRGQGVKIAILDGGFKDYALYRGSELPLNFHGAYFGTSFESDSKHGTQCTQVIFDVAPNAEFWLIQFDTYLQFLAAMDTVQAKGIDVVSCSMGFFGYGWPDGSSQMSQRVQQLKNAGILWVNSAGNHAYLHWRGQFQDMNLDGYHDFTSTDIGNSFFMSEGTELRVSLFWNNYPASSQDFDLELRESTSGTLVVKSTAYQTGSQPPEEFISCIAPITGQYYLAIKKFSSSVNPIMHLYVLEGTSELEYFTESRSILLPGDSRGSLTVGAVPWNSPHTIEDFSSRGPSEDSRVKPEMVAPDGISVKEGSGTTTVHGTSFACPHVAGAAAVYLSYKPLVVPSAVADTFKAMCIDLGTAGHDNTYGWGLLHLKMRNAIPVITNPGNKTINENNLLAFTVTATDSDDDPLTFSAFPLPEGATLGSTSGSFAWQPTFDQSGTYNITFLVTDGQLSAQKTISITVINVNRAPNLVNPGNQAVAASSIIAFTLTASDPDNDRLTFSATSLPSGASLNSGNGLFNWQPSAGQVGTHSITFKVSDGKATDQESMSVIVSLANRPPLLASIGDKSVNENTICSFTVSATDPDNNPVSYFISQLPTGAVFSNSSGDFYWQPTYQQAGIYNLTFAVTDGQATDQETIQITVVNVNRAPVLVSPGNKSVSENSSLAFTVTATDPDGDILAMSATPLPTGAALGSTTGDFYWQPTYQQAGVYNVTFSVADGQATDQEGIEITVINVNRGPVLVSPGNKSVSENSSLAFTVTATDPDGDVLTISTTPLPAGAAFNSASGDFYWQPTYEQAGTYDIIFSVTDGQTSDQKAIQIIVNNTNRTPAWFDLTGPVDDDTVKSASALLCWRHAVDPDIGDVMNYTLYYSTVDTSSWQHTVPSVIDSQYTLGSLEASKKYFWKVVAQDNAGATAQCNKAFSFVAADVTPPSFAVDVLMNPVLPFELDLYFYPTEPLGGLPEVTIVSPSGSSGQSVTQLSNRDAACYLTDYHVGPSGSYTITVCGTDPSSNRGCKNENFSASRIFVNSGVEFESPTGAIRLSIPTGWARDNGLVVYKERTIGSSDVSFMNIPIDVTPILVVDLTATVANSNKPLLLTVDARAMDFSVGNGRTVVLVPIGNMESRLTPTRINVSTGEYIAEISDLGSYVIGTADIDKLEVLPSAYRLEQNSPNPFNGWTEIPFSTSEQVHVTIDVFNVLGQKVATLADLDLSAGSYSISWDGRTDAGEVCGSGTYFYRLTAGSHVETKKMLYLK